MIEYIVGIQGFDWDSDYYVEDVYEDTYETLEKAEKAYQKLMAIKANDTYRTRPVFYIHWKDNKVLSNLTGIQHGGVFTGTAYIDKVTIERLT